MKTIMTYASSTKSYIIFNQAGLTHQYLNEYT